MLTGSDYSDGTETVGPVTGLEILAEFPGNGLEPLKLFKDWWKETKSNPAMPPGTKLKEKLRKLQVPESFPSDRINLAYLNPDIDNSTEKFSWAVPNFVAVRDFASEKFGWTKGKIDEIIKPVIKKLSVKNSQDRIDNFFSSTRISLPEKGHYQSSKRVEESIGKVLGKNPENNESSSINISKNKNPTKRKSEDSNQPSTSKNVKISDEI
jgi:DNA excision repair protein ERCC-5